MARGNPASEKSITTLDAEAVEIAFVAKLPNSRVATENIAFEIGKAATAGSASPEVRHRSALPGAAVGQGSISACKAGADLLQRNAGLHGSPPPASRNGDPSAAFTVSAAVKIRLGN